MNYTNRSPSFSGNELLELFYKDPSRPPCGNGSGSESVSSDSNENKLLQCVERNCNRNESSSDGDDSADSEIDDADVDATVTLKSEDDSIIWLTKPVKRENFERWIQIDGRFDAQPKSIKESFDVFFDDKLKDFLLKHTNENGSIFFKDKWKNVDKVELEATLGILILSGIFKSKGQEIKEFWEECTAIVRFRATSSYNRYQDIMRCIKFGYNESPENELASVSEFVEIFADNCRKRYAPSTDIVVGQQLYLWKGNCELVRSYMRSMPGKVGLKYWIVLDAANNYCVNLLLSSSSNKCSKLEIIDNLCRHVYDDQCKLFTFNNIEIDYQTCHGLLQKNIYVLGIAQKSDKKLPSVSHFKRKRYQSFYSQDTTFCLYVLKPENSRPLLSTLPTETGLDVIKHFSLGNRTVANFNKLVETYSVKMKTRHWPMTVFYNVLDVACHNASVTWNATTSNKKMTISQKRLFLKQLGLELTEPQVQSRAKSQVATQSSKRLMEHTGIPQIKVEPIEISPGTCKRRRCHACPRSIDRKSQVTCHRCKLPVCREHSVTTVVCHTCKQSEPLLKAEEV